MGFFNIWVFIALSLLSGITAPVEDVQFENPGIIIVGDSRTVGMDLACNCEAHANVFVVAKVAQGYSWLIETAADEVEWIQVNHPEIDHWTIVSNLGINDLDNCEKYINYYKTIQDDFIFVSVNPVKYHKWITNAKIEEFNARMREEFNYIDTYSMLQLEGYSSSDGVHYSNSTYRAIFNQLAYSLGIE